MALLKDIKPRNIGPGGMSGRITAIDVVTDDPQVMYVGSASGGLFKSTGGGVDWKPVLDSMNILSVGAIAIDQSNPDVVWVGTGEGNPRNSVTGGYGVYKSLDAGRSWQLMGLQKTRNVQRIIINKDNPDIVYVGAIGSSWGEHPERGVLRTKDGGKTWKKILFVNEKTGVADMVVDPTNPNKLIVAMWEHQRKPWTFKSGGPGSGLYLTVDGGDHWKKITDKDGLPKGELGRIGLAIAPSQPTRVYALVESKKNAFYRSDDGGYTWKKMSDKESIGNRPFYYSDIFVDPVNENRIYTVFTYINVSEDGGKTFSRWADSYFIRGVHPDHHAFWIHPSDPDFIMEGNDGGLNITRDRGKTWRFAENIPVAQFYHINVDNELPYHVYGGMQDNGSWAGPAYVFKSGGIRNSYWQELMFGDGFDVIPDPEDASRGFAMSQQGFVGPYDLTTGHVEMIRPTHPDPDMRLRFNWNAAIAMDPFDSKTLYFGSQFVHKSTNQGNSWTIISPDLTTNDPNKQKQDESGGLTIDATGAENNTTILAIEPSPIEKGLLWVGTDDGNVQLTRNGGNSWTKVSTNMPGLPAGAWVPQIRASRYHAGEAYVIVNNYRQFDFKPYLFRTRDYGAIWEQLLNKPEEFGYTLALAQDPIEPKLIFLGTEHGLYVSLDEAASWTKWTNGFPSVSTMDLAIQPREADLVIATFGRAAWVLDDIRPLRELAKNGTGTLTQTVHIFEPPTGVMAANQQAAGTRFAANAMYIGENRKRGAEISYSVFKEKKSNKPESNSSSKRSGKNKKQVVAKKSVDEKTNTKDKKSKPDSISFNIYNAGNELIRTLKIKYKENGLHRIYWGMDEKGVRFPSREEAKRRRNSEPGGQQVLPGKYKIVAQFLKHKDSTTIQVIADPRLNTPINVLTSQYSAGKNIEMQIAMATKANNALKKSNKVIEDILKQIKDEKGEPYDSLEKIGKATKDSLKVLVDELIGPKSKKQGIVRSLKPTIMSYYFSALRYLGSSLKSPGPTEERLMGQAKNKLEPWLDRVNHFYSTTWANFRQVVKNADLSPFKPIPTFEIK